MGNCLPCIHKGAADDDNYPQPVVAAVAAERYGDETVFVIDHLTVNVSIQ